MFAQICFTFRAKKQINREVHIHFEENQSDNGYDDQHLYMHTVIRRTHYFVFRHQWHFGYNHVTVHLIKFSTVFTRIF